MNNKLIIKKLIKINKLAILLVTTLCSNITLKEYFRFRYSKVYQPLALTCLFLLVLFMSSFSLMDAREDSRIDSREEKLSKQEQRRQERFEKRKENIAHKISHAKNDKQKQALQKKLRGIQKKQDGGNPVFGVVGMVLGILAFLFLLIYTVSAFMPWGNPLQFIALYLLIAAFVNAFAGLGLSITGLILSKKKPDTFSGKGFAIAGIIISAITLGIVLLALFAHN